MRRSVLRFQTYVYKAVRSASPDVWIRAQVFRWRRQVMTTTPGRVPVVGDLARLSFWSEIVLRELPPGRYVLQVTATERVNFYVE